ncbi:DUF3040 domain-containing protein [Streptomyces wuyuanensis]|uniref:DUF3040 domain-containing protein n=1 Tax=Streptomyces wuyuanensis TaxID=1196353 RepID=UPI0037204529
MPASLLHSKQFITPSDGHCLLLAADPVQSCKRAGERFQHGFRPAGYPQHRGRNLGCETGACQARHEAMFMQPYEHDMLTEMERCLARDDPDLDARIDLLNKQFCGDVPDDRGPRKHVDWSVLALILIGLLTVGLMAFAAARSPSPPSADRVETSTSAGAW